MARSKIPTTQAAGAANQIRTPLRPVRAKRGGKHLYYGLMMVAAAGGVAVLMALSPWPLIAEKIKEQEAGAISAVPEALAEPAEAPAAPPAPSKKPEVRGIPLFEDPERAAKLPLQMGLKDTNPNSPAWRTTGGDHWHAQAKVVTVKGFFTKQGDIDNSITCYQKGPDSRHITEVTWKAQVFNEEREAGMKNPTLSHFRHLCRTYVRELGCQVPKDWMAQDPIMKAEHFETADAVFDLQRREGKFGFIWDFKISKK